MSSNILILLSLILAFNFTSTEAYTRWLYSLRNFSATEFEIKCMPNGSLEDGKRVMHSGKTTPTQASTQNLENALRDGFWIIVTPLPVLADPYAYHMKKIQQLLYGAKAGESIEPEEVQTVQDPLIREIELDMLKNLSAKDPNFVDPLAHFPNGQIMRGELFNNKSGVHFPPREFVHLGHAMLQVTSDYMQTAINAFFILLEGNELDVGHLPADYVLRSARTISMMKIPTEKLTKLWEVVKRGRKPSEVQYHELEMFRPLFRYVNAREITRLNLTDERILTYIGTHPDLDRHKMGVVASKYIQMNKNWNQVYFLNRMNNLLCGVPMNYMRRISSEVYLQLTHQVFYHVRACEPMQRRFYLAMMTRTEALGRAFSWSADDISRLGLLLTEVNGPDLASIRAEAMAGITAQVMMEIPAQNLQYFSDAQLKYLGLKPLNILVRKLKALSEKPQLSGLSGDQSARINIDFKYLIFCAFLVILVKLLLLGE